MKREIARVARKLQHDFERGEEKRCLSFESIGEFKKIYIYIRWRNLDGKLEEIIFNEDDYLPVERGVFRSFLQFAEVGRNRMGVVRVTTLDPAEKHLVLMDQLFTEDEMGHGAGERAHREQDHAPSDPLRPVTLAPVIRKQERGADLPDLRR